MTAKLTRNEAGDYIVTAGDRTIRIQKGLGRDWHVSPMTGLDFKPAQFGSYGDAKKFADATIRRGVHKHTTFARGEVARPDLIPEPPTGEAPSRIAPVTLDGLAATLRGWAEVVEKVGQAKH